MLKRSRPVDRLRSVPVRQLLAGAALLGAAVVIAALFIAVGHSVALQVSGRLGEADLAIQRGRWALVAGSIAAFLSPRARRSLGVANGWIIFSMRTS
jgi:hypothetical protein